MNMERLAIIANVNMCSSISTTNVKSEKQACWKHKFSVTSYERNAVSVV
ncbi:MAG: hypothetical protein J6W84_07255 [Bacteroidales bacterium]|nr:hypothetical protein [Bacteroidales bacterium]